MQASIPPVQPAERTIATRTVFRGRALHIDVVDIEQLGGRRSTREIVRHRGAAAVLGCLPDGRFLFVRQYRKAIEQALLEVVAGSLEPGEAPEVCAHRELREESGYRARELRKLAVIVPCPGYSEERLHLYCAQLEEPPGATAPDADEQVESVILTAAEVEAAIAAGTICDAKTLACWLYWRLQGGWR